MSINCTQLKLLRAASLGIFIVLLSVSLNASELRLNTEAPQNNSVSIIVSELTEIQATLSEQEKTIKLLFEKQLSNKKEHALEAITSEKAQPTEETRLESIESLLSSMTNKNKYFTYADWAAVAITCVAVLLTIVGLAIAALAFWGYREIKDITKNSAAEEAKSVAKQTMEELIYGVAKSELEKLINDGKLREPLQNAVDMILRSDSNNVEKNRTEELFHELDISESEFDGSEDDESLGSGKK